ncbi:tripartite motif-containing protein 45-like [Mytilus californianus]|uniref:tripartite motif-containing protein 45-like n=1 Tax=Mytilus californianus TaxID=6549 RepID=UPI002247077E|nr:tripartite motif-containing protein 45-like [Mytilus californianus]
MIGKLYICYIMAYSLKPHSARRAQVLKDCDLCKANANVHYKCVQCKNYMCKSCSKIHHSERTSQKHEVIDIISLPFKTSEAFQLGKMDNFTCKRHKKKMCVAFCEDCEVPVCKRCMDKIHDDHNVLEIIEHCQNQAYVWESRILKDLSFCQNEMKQIQNIDSKYESAHENELRMIDQREYEFKNAIHKYANELRDVIEKERQLQKQHMEDSKKKVTETEQILTTKQDQLRTSKTK